MALIEHDLFRGKIDRVQIAIDRLKMFEPEEGYSGSFGGGKDSVVVKRLCEIANPPIKVDWHYYLTTIDPLLWYIL